jgi:hypothetical protein
MLQLFLEATFKLLRDQSWGAIGGVMLPLLLFIFQQIRPTGRIITHTVIKNDVLPHPTHGSTRFIIWKIWNSGNESIETSHYERPIQFTFGSNAEVLDARIRETQPVGIGDKPAKNRNNVVLAPVLLNVRDSITLEFWLARADDVKVDLRIVGKTINAAELRQKLFIRAVKFRNIILILFVVWLLSFLAHVKYPQVPAIYYVSVLLAFLISLLATLSIVYYCSAISRR